MSSKRGRSGDASGYLRKLVGDKLRTPRSKWGDGSPDRPDGPGPGRTPDRTGDPDVPRTGDPTPPRTGDPDSPQTGDIPPPILRDEPLPSKEMEPEYVGEDDPFNPDRFFYPITRYYFDEEELEAARVFVRDGRLYRASDGLPCNAGHEFELPDGEVRKVPDIYVMDPHGNLYTTSVMPDEAGHSTYLAGMPVLCAGNIVVEDGVLRRLDNWSGHYKPTEAEVERALEELRRQGVDTSNVESELYDHAADDYYM